MKFRKKPVEIEAVQLCWSNWSELCDFMGNVISEDNPGRNSEAYSDTCGEASPWLELNIPTLEGTMTARHGDWIIRGVQGEFYPCKPDVFKETYDIVG